MAFKLIFLFHVLFGLEYSKVKVILKGSHRGGSSLALFAQKQSITLEIHMLPSVNNQKKFIVKVKVIAITIVKKCHNQ